MNPILAALLTVLVVSAGLLVFYGAIAVIVALDIALNTPDLLSPEEATKEIKKHWLGKFAYAIEPVAFWWMLPFRHLRRKP